MLVGLDHVQLAMPAGAAAEADAEAFYGDLLGLERVPKPPALAARGGCWFRGGPVEVHLGVEEPFRPAKKAHPAFDVDDLAELCARLEAADIIVRPDHEIEGVTRVHVDDPFGNRIELIQA